MLNPRSHIELIGGLRDGNRTLFRNFRPDFLDVEIDSLIDGWGFECREETGVGRLEVFCSSLCAMAFEWLTITL